MPASTKIVTVAELAGIAAALRAARQTVVHCHGSFDPVDVSAVRLLERAKQRGDVLLVTLAPPPDDGREDFRAEMLAALAAVSHVATCRPGQSPQAIEGLRPDVFVAADEDRPKTRNPCFLSPGPAMADAAGRVSPIVGAHAPGAPAPFSAAPPHLSPEAFDFVTSFAARHDAAAVLGCLESIRSQRVLLVGETIIDEYHYCETMGKSGKEPILAVKYLSAERFPGGVVAAATQCADFVDRVGILSFLGAGDSQEPFIRQRLPTNVDATFLGIEGAPTTIKRRFVEVYPFQKLFEVYVMLDEIDARYAQDLYARLEALLPSYDAVLVTDYGHGMLTPELVDLMCSRSRFLAVNTQTNAANHGFNTVSKYRRADYICVSEKELRLEARSRTKDLRAIIAEIAARLSCGCVFATRGEQGCLCYGREQGFFPVPAFTQRVVDRIGAGDAVLAVTAACVAQGIPMEVVGFLGNSVGALAVETVGHRSIVSRATLCRHIASLLSCKQHQDRPNP